MLYYMYLGSLAKVTLCSTRHNDVPYTAIDIRINLTHSVNEYDEYESVIIL